MPPSVTPPPPRAAAIDYATLKTELVYGRSRSGKTSWLLKLARYLYLKTGKRTVWLLGDGGGETVTCTGWADPGGFIDLWPFIARDNPLETTQLICEGYWPLEPMNPTTKMVRHPDIENIGLWVIEGLTVMSDYIMGDRPGGLQWRSARGEVLNNDAGFKIKDGEMMFGGNSRTHYGFVQRKMLDLIGRTTRLPGIKCWTAHETKVDDQENRESIYGPDVVGVKLTPRIGGSFGNTIHMHVAHVEKTLPDKDPTTGKPVKRIMEEFRAYTCTHFDPDAQTTAKYYANARMDARVRERFPDLMPDYLAPADPVRFYGLLDEARKRESELDKDIAAQIDIELVRPLMPKPSTTRIIDVDDTTQ